MKSQWKFWRYSQSAGVSGNLFEGLFPAHIEYEETAAYLAQVFPNTIYFILDDSDA